MYSNGTPTSQRAEVRPISFLLDDFGDLGAPVTLRLRPEDLTRPEPSRVTVNQTLGRETSGWVDNFGKGLPSVSISGHTGWRPTGVSALDGVQSFLALNQLVSHEYHDAKQAAINAGRDPALVKLLFVDMLDNFAWNVAPTQFVLRRNRSRPLLMQYNINLQAIDTSVDVPDVLTPDLGSISAGLNAMDAATDSLDDWIGAAVSEMNGALAPIAAIMAEYAKLSNDIFRRVKNAVAASDAGLNSVLNTAIVIARDMATIGVNVSRTISVLSDSTPLKSSIGRVSAAFNEVVCLFSNSLRPRKSYAVYDGLYGASNCSSTTGGRPRSAYINENVFALLQPSTSPVQMNSAAMSSAQSLIKIDPVLTPMSTSEMARHLGNVVAGTTVSL